MIERTINLTLHKNSHNKDEWNNSLDTFEDKNIFQSYEWGELKKLKGWDVLHILITDDTTSKNLLIAQVLIKKILGVKVAWCPGGPILQCDVTSGIEILEKFRDAIYNERIFNLRCKPYMADTEENKKIFTSVSKSKYLIGSNKSSILKISDGDYFLTQVKKKHRYYIKQSQKSDLRWEVCIGNKMVKTFSFVYTKMKKHKGLSLPMIDIGSFSKILNVNKDPEPRLFLYTGFEGNNPVTACVISILGNKAFYHYAASTERSREISASYGMIYNLVTELRRRSIQELDLGGISIDGSSSGVDFFKLGFNGRELSKIDEFDISKSKLYTYLFSRILHLKLMFKG